MTDKEIDDLVRLNWILDRLILFGGNVSSNDLHSFELYNEYNDDQLKIDNNFKHLQSEFYKSGASRIVYGQDDYLICCCDETYEFKKEFENFENYYSIIKENIKLEETKKKQKETIEKRKNAIVNHNYWFTIPKNIIGIVVIILTFIGLGTYKDIKECLKSDKESEVNQQQEHKTKEVHKLNELKTKNQQESNNNIVQKETDSTEKKTNETKQLNSNH